MAKDINLTSSEWTDIIFEGKNKEYGAYRMRQTSAKRHYVAIVVMLIVVVFVAILPSLIEAVKSKDKIDNVSGVTELSNLKLEDQVKEQDIIRQQEATPPPPLKSTIKFTPPVITDAKDIKEEDEMKSQTELNESKVTVSVADVKGTDDKHGVDIADLKDHKVVVQEEEEKPFVGVEQMPQFPGGERELMGFLSKNLKYPTIAAENGIQGRVTLRFVVSKTGEITDVNIIKGLDPSCDKEAVRVVKTMPKWIPGKQNGRNVPVYYTLPVVFRLQ
jgi:protein TonB